MANNRFVMNASKEMTNVRRPNGEKVTIKKATRAKTKGKGKK